MAQKQRQARRLAFVLLYQLCHKLGGIDNKSYVGAAAYNFALAAGLHRKLDFSALYGCYHSLCLDGGANG